MLDTLLLLLAFQFIGELLVRLFNLPVPGQVVGMIFLLITLIWRGKVRDSLRQGAGNLLQNMSILFIPAAVGISLHLGRLQDEWLPIVASLVLSLFIGMAVTAYVLRYFLRQQKSEPKHD